MMDREPIIDRKEYDASGRVVEVPKNCAVRGCMNPATHRSVFMFLCEEHKQLGHEPRPMNRRQKRGSTQG